MQYVQVLQRSHQSACISQTQTGRQGQAGVGFCLVFARGVLKELDFFFF